ncbi:Zn-dependent exopeptidase [Phanerochaete sordida]|uniref:Zn-dependent exopeptidase n=1 Tax=Phanerochaete sordida TaxID=48140 RepID=A0A9P3FXE2_9APHY|nr:Zn-dependent exopeptidase [Phanerochaete sordida]
MAELKASTYPSETFELEGQPLATSRPRQSVFRRKLWLAGLLTIYVLAREAVPAWSFSNEGPAYDAYDGDRQVLTSEKTEQLFLSVPNEASALAASRAYATHPHLASSKEDLDDAKVILKLFQDEFGIAAPEDEPVFSAGTDASRNATLSINKLTAPTAWIDVYYPIMNTPLDRALQIIDEDGQAIWDADLVEDGDPLDPDAAKYRDYIPTWHGLSCDGDVSGQLVYANYGRKEDYDELVAKGINLTGKIVITRYGAAIGRGIKVEGAQRLGAVGVLIYDDPRDDGSVTVENGYEPYPAGPARNPTSVQRGSVQYLTLYPGDPTTPGYPAYENATRMEGENIPKIPSLPISWANAQRLLAEISHDHDARALTGKPSHRKVRLVNHVDDKVMPIWNTMVAIPGHIKDETVLIGCHRDAWVMGAADPVSGTVAVHEVVKGFGTLLRNGWKPTRNIVIASWDAEEYGLVGSTEYAEDFAEWITDNVVTYINLDVSAMGSAWVPMASPSLAYLIRLAAQDVPHPTDAGRTLWDARSDLGPFTNGLVDADALQVYNASRRTQSKSTGIAPLGSGSDFTAFLQRLGIAAMDQAFTDTLSDARYHMHSIYDSQRWQEIYADPGFHRNVAVARHLGLVALRVTDSIVLPLNTTQYALELDDYLDLVLDDAPTDIVASVDFATLRRAFKRLQRASAQHDAEKTAAEKRFRELLAKLPRRAATLRERWAQRMLALLKGQSDPVREFRRAAKRVQRANDRLRDFEKGFLHEDGIKGREWYRHLIIAPGRWLGYGATPLPSIYDALVLEQNVTLAKHEVKRVEHLLHKMSSALKP